MATLLGVLFVIGVTYLCYKYSGWFWLLFVAAVALFGVSFGLVTLTYLVCMFYLTIEKEPVYIFAIILLLFL